MILPKILIFTLSRVLKPCTEAAEGFLRFRQGYNSMVFSITRDIFRKKSNSLMQAFIKQKVTLSNLLKSLPSPVIQRNIITSVTNLETVISYGALAEEAVRDEYRMESVEIQFSEKRIGGVDYLVIKQAEADS